jgi:nucleotide-binding universal stress UspA family protein
MTDSNNNNNNKESNRGISKILTAIDGSEPSIDAADYAVYISSKFDADLYAIHVIEDPGFVNIESFGVYDIETPTERKALMQDRGGKAKEWFDKIKLNANAKDVKLLKAEIVGTSSSIESAIVDYAEKNRIDLIVVGTKGRSGFKKLLLGSVASGVVHHARCPVMIVK